MLVIFPRNFEAQGCQLAPLPSSRAGGKVGDVLIWLHFLSTDTLIQTHVHTDTCIHEYIREYAHTHIHAYIQHTYKNKHINIHTHIYKRNNRLYTITYTRAHEHTHVHGLKHTHTHTYLNPNTSLALQSRLFLLTCYINFHSFTPPLVFISTQGPLFPRCHPRHSSSKMTPPSPH